MESTQTPITSYILSLIGGVIILITGVVGLAWFGASGPNWSGFGGWMSNMMNNTHNFMGGDQYGFFSVLSLLGLFAGIIIIVGAVMLGCVPKIT